MAKGKKEREKRMAKDNAKKGETENKIGISKSTIEQRKLHYAL